MKITDLRYWLCYGSVIGVSVALLGGCGGDNKAPGNTPAASAASAPAADTPVAGSPAASAPIADGSSSPASSALPPPVNKPVAKADQPYEDPNVYSSASAASLPSNAALDMAAITHHTMTLKGEQIDYTATAGHLTALAPNPDGTKPVDKQVSVFYVAYTRDDKPVGTRPVTFFWNGGPGSSTVWLHLGSWGPKTLQVDEAAFTPAQLKTQPASFPLVDNDVSMLDDSDLVFVDATGTGYSQAIAPHTNGEFWGTDADAKIFRDFITRYIAVNNRGASPKYLYGESYGGIRTPIVADLLLQVGKQDKAGTALTGIILNSPLVSYKTNCDMSPGISCAGFIPSYAAIAHSKKIATDPLAAAAELPGYMDQLRLFVAEQWVPELLPYTQKTFNGLYVIPELFTKSEKTLFADLAGKTGLTSGNWMYKWNMGSGSFRSAMLTQLGLGSNASHMNRYNGMVTIPATSTYDAQNYNQPAFVSQIADFLPSFLKYRSSSTYSTMTSATIAQWKWPHGTDTSNRPTSLPDLTEALTLNPALKVVVFHGYHDIATPFHQTELDLAGADLADTVPVKSFPGGHMIYLTKDSRQPMKRAIDDFFNSAHAATQ